MKLSARSILTVALVVAMLGSGVAFATGANVAPRPHFCLGNLFGYGNVCTTAKPARKAHHKRRKRRRHKQHHVSGQSVSRRGPGFTG